MCCLGCVLHSCPAPLAVACSPAGGAGVRGREWMITTLFARFFGQLRVRAATSLAIPEAVGQSAGFTAFTRPPCDDFPPVARPVDDSTFPWGSPAGAAVRLSHQALPEEQPRFGAGSRHVFQRSTLAPTLSRSSTRPGAANPPRARRTALTGTKLRKDRSDMATGTGSQVLDDLAAALGCSVSTVDDDEDSLVSAPATAVPAVAGRSRATPGDEWFPETEKARKEAAVYLGLEDEAPAPPPQRPRLPLLLAVLVAFALRWRRGSCSPPPSKCRRSSRACVGLAGAQAAVVALSSPRPV